MAVNDRKCHLEGDLPDGLVGQMQRERLVPQFKRGNYSQGIYDTIQAYVATLAAKRGFNVEGHRPEFAYRATATTHGKNGSVGLPSSCCTALIILFVVILILSSSRGGGGGGCLNMLLLGSLFSGGRRSGWGGSSGWGGGGFGAAEAAVALVADSVVAAALAVVVPGEVGRDAPQVLTS